MKHVKYSIGVFPVLSPAFGLGQVSSVFFSCPMTTVSIQDLLAAFLGISIGSNHGKRLMKLPKEDHNPDEAKEEENSTIGLEFAYQASRSNTPRPQKLSRFAYVFWSRRRCASVIE